MISRTITKLSCFKYILCLGIIAPVIAADIPSFAPKQILENSQLSTSEAVNLITDSFWQKKPLGELNSLKNLQQAYQIQSQVVQNLESTLGKKNGYKVGLTNPIVQEKFKINHPVRGVLLKKMLLPSGSTVSANFGAIPLIEGDLMVRVGDNKINTATNTKEVIQSLDAVIPFLELPDLMYDKTVTLTGEKLVAINVGARLGVIGKAIPIENPQVWQQKLSTIQLILRDETGKELSQGNSQALLGDPLKVVLWLRDDLKSQGKRLQKGDLISLGTITPLTPITSGKTFYASYFGLNDHQPIEISVTFK